MQSKLARELKDDLIASARRLSPEERLRAFTAHSRLVRELYEARRKRHAASAPRSP